ncbi:MAG TPA: transposase [Chloroflexota bacterium]|nr:transposase [Chloroflexota bacterium]
MNGKLTRTVCIKLDVGEHAPALSWTQEVFSQAATWIARVCWAERIGNSHTAHRRVYGETRTRFGLGAQLACCARAKAVEAITATQAKGEGACPVFDPRGSVRYDARTYRLMIGDRISLHTLAGRVICRLLPGARQRTMLADPTWRMGGADLVLRDGTYYLHLTQTARAPAKDFHVGVLGVDLGQVQLATDSDGQSFSGAKVKGVRHYYAHRRARLQHIGTRSAKRRLKRIKRKESRFQRQANHMISKILVAKAAGAAKALALEDLSGILERVTVRAAQRSYRLSWAFCQLRTHISYKAAQAGVPVILVDPAYTSQTCSACGHCERANRQSQSSFRFCRCGFALNADHNAARNIAYRAAANQPMVSETSHPLAPGGSQSVRDAVPGTSPRALVVGS